VPVNAGTAAGLWPASGHALLQADEHGSLRPSDDWWRGLLARPELAPIAESCQSERALHAALLDEPTRTVTPERLARLQDADAQENYAVFLAFRDALLAAGTLQAYYLSLFRSGSVNIPPAFVDHLAQLILCQLLQDSGDAFEARAAELLFRPQRVTLQNGRVLAADRDTVDQRQQTGGLGELGRLLLQAQVNLGATDMTVLNADNAAGYWQRSGRGDNHYPYLLDLTPQKITQDLGHGLQFQLSAANGGLAALGRVLQRWVAHLLGVRVRITVVERINDQRWRWHIGLDAEATALLNDLYQGAEVDAERQRRLLGLFRLDFEDPAEMRADVAGRPVYLGLAMAADGVLRLKPQNLLTNLPLREPS
jgi:hypothetical protein